MSISCESLGNILKDFSLVKQCDTLPDGTLRIATPFQYPNGSFIDVFLQEVKALPAENQNFFCGHMLSDCGQTATYLLDLHIKPWTTKRKKLILQDICAATGVQDNSGELQILIETDRLDTIAPAMVMLAQACIRITDLSHMQRFPVVPTFRDEVEEFIDQASVGYEADQPVKTIYGKDIYVDFVVRGRQKSFFVKTISTNIPDVAHRQLVEVFAKWHDLQNHRDKDKQQFVTVVEDKPLSRYQPSDLKRLEDVSDAVVYFPSEQDRFRETLAA
jgi:hypothetical protein